MECGKFRATFSRSRVSADRGWGEDSVAGKVSVKFRVEGRLLIAAVEITLLLVAAPRAAEARGPRMPPGHVVELLGSKVRYYDAGPAPDGARAGDGPNLIFLHGLGGDAADWAPNIGPVSKHYHVYALDQIGFGRSDKPSGDYKIETFVTYLEGFMQVLNIPKATLVGNSLGGWIAAEFAIRHPDRVDKLVLVDAAGLRARASEILPVFGLAAWAEKRQQLEGALRDRRLVEIEFERFSLAWHLKRGDSKTIERVVASVLAGKEFLDDNAAAIRAPTLVLWGRNDLWIPLAMGERLAKAVPGAKLVVLDRCGHLPQLERPTEFNSALLEFLAVAE